MTSCIQATSSRRPVRSTTTTVSARSLSCLHLCPLPRRLLSRRPSRISLRIQKIQQKKVSRRSNVTMDKTGFHPKEGQKERKRGKRQTQMEGKKIWLFFLCALSAAAVIALFRVAPAPSPLILNMTLKITKSSFNLSRGPGDETCSTTVFGLVFPTPTLALAPTLGPHPHHTHTHTHSLSLSLSLSVSSRTVRFARYSTYLHEMPVLKLSETCTLRKRLRRTFFLFKNIFSE